jgi:hypothetical protein
MPNKKTEICACCQCTIDKDTDDYVCYNGLFVCGPCDEEEPHAE